MNSESTRVVQKSWTAAELRTLPAEERDAILAAAAALAEGIYRNDPQLTDFQAFGEEDLHVLLKRPSGWTGGPSGPVWG